MSAVFFFYDQLLIREKTEDEKANSLLAYLAGDTFSFHYGSYVDGDSLREAACEYHDVRSNFMGQFGKKLNSEDGMRDVVNCL